MSVYPNPFHARASEHHRDPHQFVTTFGAGAVDMLPGSLWDRLIVVRSTPGAGKTSLMRLFSAESLDWIADRMDKSEAVHKVLSNRAVLVKGTPSILATRVDLDRDYKALLDLGLGDSLEERLFLRLLDTRIMTGVIRAALRIARESYPSGADQFRIDATDDEPGSEAAIVRLGGPTGAGLLGYARDTERRTLELLDALLASDLSRDLQGHSRLLSLEALDNAQISVGDQVLPQQVVLMFDDGHALASAQRSVLLANLKQRRPSVGRWYAERFEALSNQEMMEGAGAEGRDVTNVNLDLIAQQRTGSRFTKNRHDSVLADIAIRRAVSVLANYAREDREFFALLEDPANSGSSSSIEQGITTVRSRLLSLLGDYGRYAPWFEGADALQGRKSLVRWKEIEILINRDLRKGVPLFGEEPPERLASRSDSSTREAAELLAAKEFGLPFYAGRRRIIGLGSSNIEQFLNLCGILFDELLVDVSLGKKPHLSADRQDLLLTRASERYWNSIATTIPSGREVQTLVSHIIKIAHKENQKPNMPYPPGVTGTALLMEERTRLLDPSYRRETPGAERLLVALASAVSYNVIAARFNQVTGYKSYMVLYLNRLLCPRFDLPLGLGGYRERRLSEMLSWMHAGSSDPISEPLPLVTGD